MVVQMHTLAFRGIDAILVKVQVHAQPGNAGIKLVGLPDKTIVESTYRIRAAFHSIGLALPFKRYTVNLSPADMEKVGTHYDLPIALGLLCYENMLPTAQIAEYLCLGELSLDGAVNTVPGVLSAALTAVELNKGILCPMGNALEARWAGEALSILPIKHIMDIVLHFKDGKELRIPDRQDMPNTKSQTLIDMADIKGQAIARRAAEIAVAGGHNLLMVGSPGSGKSMLARRMIGIFPEMTSKEILDINMIASIAGELNEGGLILDRPFRDPHYSCSVPAMVGGGKKIRPGEVTLSHHGVLFLDELPEFPRVVLESLRQPIESRSVTIARAEGHSTFPASFLLVAAMNPCKCGHLGNKLRQCHKVPYCGMQYQSKISGPLLDRFDIRIFVPTQDIFNTEECEVSESSTLIQSRVIGARKIQLDRLSPYNLRMNAEAEGVVLEKTFNISSEGKELMVHAYRKLQLSMRGYHRAIRVARTIADLDSSEMINGHHVAEALHYRGAEDIPSESSPTYL